MPCMWNGKPVKGNKGSCPTNSTWVEPEALAPVDDRNMFQKLGTAIKENPLEAASYAAMAIPGLGWAGGGALAGTRALLSGGKMASRTGNLMDKLFRKSGGTVFKPPVAGGGVLQGGQKFTPKMFNQTTKGGLPVQSHFSAYKAPYNKMAGRVMRKPSLRGAGMTGLAGAGVGGLYASGKDDRLATQQALQTQQQQQASTAMDANTKALMDANATKAETEKKTAETKRRASLTNTQRIFEDMKKPGYWSKPMSDLPHDTRLNRLSMLMDYYGKDPVQRAAVDSPQQQWKATEEGKLERDTAFAKAQAELMNSGDAYKWSYDNVNKALSEWYDDKFGTDFWFGKDKDKLKEKFMTDVTDEKARYPSKNLKQIAEALLNKYPDRYL